MFSFANDNLLLFLLSSLGMLANFYLFNNILRLNLSILMSLLRVIIAAKVFTPCFFCNRRIIGGVIRATVSYKVRVLLSLFFHQIFICAFIYLLRSFFICFRHFLSHYLRENTITARWSIKSLRFCLLFGLFFS